MENEPLEINSLIVFENIKDLFFKYKRKQIADVFVEIEHKKGLFAGMLSQINWVKKSVEKRKVDGAVNDEHKKWEIEYLEDRMEKLKLTPEEKVKKSKGYLELLHRVATNKNIENQATVDFIKSKAKIFFEKNPSRLYPSPLDIYPKEKIKLSGAGFGIITAQVRNDMHWATKNNNYILKRIDTLKE